MQITSLIIDDEALARRRVENLLKDINEVEILAKCKNGNEAIAKIIELKPDLIFLDIKMKDLSGFEVLNNIPKNDLPVIIFITAFDEFALKAFDYFAFDYLLKPFKDERFNHSLLKAINTIKTKKEVNYTQKLDQLLKFVDNKINSKIPIKKSSLPIKLGNKISFIKFEEIKYIKASGYYAEIHTMDSRHHLLREPLSNLILSFNPSEFIRIHRSTIVNISQVQEILHSSFGEIDVKMKDSEVFRVSKSYKKAFNKTLGL